MGEWYREIDSPRRLDPIVKRYPLNYSWSFNGDWRRVKCLGVVDRIDACSPMYDRCFSIEACSRIHLPSYSHDTPPAPNPCNVSAFFSSKTTTRHGYSMLDGLGRCPSLVDSYLQSAMASGSGIGPFKYTIARKPGPKRLESRDTNPAVYVPIQHNAVCQCHAPRQRMTTLDQGYLLDGPSCSWANNSNFRMASHAVTARAGRHGPYYKKVDRERTLLLSDSNYQDGSQAESPCGTSAI